MLLHGIAIVVIELSMNFFHMDAVLQSIRDYADQAHGAQTRKYTPDRYIVHPVRVMEICREHINDTAVLAAALLHDVLEDTPVTKEQLGDFLVTVMDSRTANRTLQLVVELTDVYVKKNFPHWNRRKRKAKEEVRMEKTSVAAQTVKYADIIDNCTYIVQHDPDFAHTFLHECKSLLKKMNKGNARLLERAIMTVNDELQQLAAATAQDRPVR